MVVDEFGFTENVIMDKDVCNIGQGALDLVCMIDWVEMFFGLNLLIVP